MKVGESNFWFVEKIWFGLYLAFNVSMTMKMKPGKLKSGKLKLAILKPGRLKKKLDSLYDRYNQREYVDPDPLLFLYDYPQVEDREIAGMIASCLAYGRVAMIMKTVKTVLGEMGPSPCRFLKNTREGDIRKRFAGFKYRFSTGDHLCDLFEGIRSVFSEYGSLEKCFLGDGRSADKGLDRLYGAITRDKNVGHLLADPKKTSACKRSHLFLRWMVRKDAVDPGGWAGASPAQLIYPIDTHMFKIGTLLGFTRRKSADKRCALEITQGFRQINPEDPVKYDFALTRFGIREQFDIKDLAAFIHSTG